MIVSIIFKNTVTFLTPKIQTRLIFLQILLSRMIVGAFYLLVFSELNNNNKKHNFKRNTFITPFRF